MEERIDVFVADDHPLFRKALADAVRQRPDLRLVGEAADGRAALEAIRRLGPDVTVLDLSMPDLDGAQVLNAVQRDSVPTRVLFVATSTDSRVVYELIAAGAAGYLDKGSPSERICDAVVAVSRGRTVLSEAVEEGVLDQVRLSARDSRPKLSPRELEILRLIAEGLSGPDVATRLYIEPSTVKTHLQRIYEKLGVSERAAAVAEGMRRGLLE